MQRVLVTGATGFIGRYVCDELCQHGFDVIEARRGERGSEAHGRRQVHFDLLAPNSLVPEDLRDIDAIVHLAARVHVMSEAARHDEFFEIPNVVATRHLARAGAAAGVRKFVFMSSIKVHGEATRDVPFTSTDTPAPEDAYGRSKLRAEHALAAAAHGSGMQHVIIRPPLVFGPGVGGNFRRMLRWIDKGWPLPLGGLANARSYVNGWNLASLVRVALTDSRANDRALLVADGTPVTTTELLERLARGMGRAPRLFAVPRQMLQAVAAMAGRSADLSRLCGSLVVDDRATRDMLGWTPPVSFDDALVRTASWYLESLIDVRR